MSSVAVRANIPTIRHTKTVDICQVRDLNRPINVINTNQLHFGRVCVWPCLRKVRMCMNLRTSQLGRGQRSSRTTEKSAQTFGRFRFQSLH